MTGSTMSTGSFPGWERLHDMLNKAERSTSGKSEQDHVENQTLTPIFEVVQGLCNRVQQIESELQERGHITFS